MEQQQQLRYTTPDRVRTKLRNGFRAVFDAQTADAEGRREEARQLYYEGCSQLTRAISMRCPETAEEVRKAHFVLSMAKERIRALEEVVPDTEIKGEEEEEGLEDLLTDMDDIHSILSGSTEAKEIISIPGGVSVFNVGTVGGVNQVASNAPAKISHIISSRHRNPVSCLQIGELVYPLVSKASPVLQVGERQFMFPSLEQTGKYIGVVLDNVSEQQLDQFQRLILSLTNLHVKSWDDVIDDGGDAASSSSSSSAVAPSAPPRPPVRPPPPPAQPKYLRTDESAQPRTVDKVSGGIQTTAEVVSAGLVWGSRVGGDLLRKGAHSLKTRIKPSSKGEVQVSENTQAQVRTIRESTHQVSVLTGQAVGQLATGISALARLIAPHISRGVQSVVAKSDNKAVVSVRGRISEQNVKDACQVGASALAGLATLYEGLEEGAKNLGRALAEGANVTVGARYGQAAGNITEDSIHSAVNVGLTYSQAQKLGAKAIAKRAGKSAAAEVVRENASKPSASSSSNNPALTRN